MTWADFVQRLQLDLLWSLVMAVLLGGAIGLERELRGKAAGLRTNILICLGSTLFTHLSIHLAGGSGDPGRIAAQVVTGIGFLGAGTILHTRGAIAGLTSAATIWLVAAIGVAIGTGAIFEVVYEIAKLLQRDTAKRPAPMVVFSGVLSGMLLLWVTGLLVK